MTATELFDKEIECNNTNILNCKCGKRIKILLNQYNNIINGEEKKSENLIEKEVDLLINTKLGNAQYSNTKLLNDFLHLKQYHKINNNNKQFEIMYNYLTMNDDDDIVKKCDINNCSTIIRHYRDRRSSLLLNNRDKKPSSSSTSSQS